MAKLTDRESLLLNTFMDIEGSTRIRSLKENIPFLARPLIGSYNRK